MDTELVKQNEEIKDLEVLSLRKRVTELESQLEEAKKLIHKHLLEVNEVDLLKMKSADTLTKAKSVIFENTKMIKNQELQIEALNQQVESLRDVVKITKELLGIRNLEVDQLETKIHCMEEKYKAEKQRQDLMHQRLEQMIRHNGDLKREYETQLCLFKALRERYDERELAQGVVDNLKSDLKNGKEKKVEQGNAEIKVVQNQLDTIESQQQQITNENQNAGAEDLKQENKNIPEPQEKTDSTEAQKHIQSDPKIEQEKNETEVKNETIIDNKVEATPKESVEQGKPITEAENPPLGQKSENQIPQKPEEQPKNVPTEEAKAENVIIPNLDSNSVKQ